jgi:hypothetical protein
MSVFAGTAQSVCVAKAISARVEPLFHPDFATKQKDRVSRFFNKTQDYSIAPRSQPSGWTKVRVPLVAGRKIGVSTSRSPLSKPAEILAILSS